MSFNKVILQGNVGRIDGTRYVPSGEPVINFSLATDEPYREGNEWKTRAAWHRCVGFGESLARRLEYAKPGSSVLVEGYLRYRKWTPAEGAERTVAEIVVHDFTFVGGKRQGQDASSSDSGGTSEEHDDIPGFDEAPPATAPAAAKKSPRSNKGKERTGAN